MFAFVRLDQDGSDRGWRTTGSQPSIVRALGLMALAESSRTSPRRTGLREQTRHALAHLTRLSKPFLLEQAAQMGGAGLEQLTPSLSIRRQRSQRSTGLRKNGSLSRIRLRPNMRGERTERQALPLWPRQADS